LIEHQYVITMVDQRDCMTVVYIYYPQVTTMNGNTSKHVFSQFET